MTVAAPQRRSRTVSIKEAAERLGVHENTIRNWIDRHLLRAYRLPSGHRKLPAEEVDRLEQEIFAMPTSFRELEGSQKAPAQAGKVEAPTGTLP